MEDAKSRLRRVIGEEGIEKLDGACVVVFGVGGVGGSCAEALVRGGVGHVVFVDGDEVQLSNVNRQAIAFQSTVGKRKVDVMCAMARDIYPDVRAEGRDTFVLPENFAEVMASLPERIDYIVDAIDTVATKLELALYAQENGIPLISSMGAANKADPTKLTFADLFKTQSCPLCRAMRKQARAKGIKALQVLYSCEQPLKPVAEGARSQRALASGAEGEQSLVSAAEGERPEAAGGDRRACLGTMSYMPPIMGQMIAGYVIRDLLA